MRDNHQQSIHVHLVRAPSHRTQIHICHYERYKPTTSAASTQSNPVVRKPTTAHANWYIYYIDQILTHTHTKLHNTPPNKYFVKRGRAPRDMLVVVIQTECH